MAQKTPAIKCAKVMVFVLNVILLLIAMILLCMGIKFYTSYADLELFLETPYFSPAAIVITVAITLLILSLLGYLSTVKESVLLLNIYSFCLTIFLILEIGAAITALIISNKAFHAIEINMKNSLSEYKSSTAIQRAWCVAQQNLHCCGVNQPFDWKSESVSGAQVVINNITFQVPLSCCLEPQNCIRSKIYTSGCWDVLKMDISGAARVLGYSILNIAILQLIGIVFSSMLAKYLRRAKTLAEMERQKNISNSFRRHESTSTNLSITRSSKA